MDDIRAVMDAAGSEQAAIYGVSEGGSMAIMFAATYPQRTRALILWGVQARWTKTDDYPWGMTREEFQKMIDKLAEEGITPEYVTGSGAGLRGADPAYL
jgi:pimeloyl-ACP methyl ester carboxylesterase